MPKRYVIRDTGVGVEGLAQLQKALRLMEHEAGPELRAKLKEIGEHVGKAAAGRVTSRTGRHGGSGKRLASSIKVSVTQTGASVYSSALHGGAQNVGGRVGRNHATILKRSEVSGYMVKAVQAEAPWVEKQTQDVIDDLLKRFEGV